MPSLDALAGYFYRSGVAREDLQIGGYRCLHTGHLSPYRSHHRTGECSICPSDPTPRQSQEQEPQSRVWDLVSRFPLSSLWNLEGIPIRVITKRTWNSLFEDNLAGRAAELGFYFIFALFPCLFTVTSLLGLAAHSASHIYYLLLGYLSIVLPQAAMGTLLETFNQITSSSTGGKLTFGIVASLWSASVGFSAIQDGLNIIYKVKETRPYLAARFSAISVTILLSILITLILASLLGADYFGRMADAHIHPNFLAILANYSVKSLSWLLSTCLLFLMFAVIYYFAPDVKRSHWHWLSPGATVGVLGWLVACLGFRIYVHLVGDYAGTYGSLGAVIILLTWFYLTGFVLLLGAEINSEIEAAVVAQRVLHN
jgi:membrane protein